jgi:hypothetical protein
LVCHGWERMDRKPVGYLPCDCYDLLHVGVTLLRMSAVADREARARRGAAEFSRKLGRLSGQAEDFEAAAAALDSGSTRAAICAGRLRELAVRLTGLSGWRAGVTR